MAKNLLLTKNARIAPRLSAAQSSKSNCLPGTKNFCINSVVMPHIQVARVILIKSWIFSFLLDEVFLNGRQNRNTIPPNRPACTSLSKSIKSSQPASGRLSPGTQIKYSTNKNQAMPGKNLITLKVLKEALLFKSVIQFYETRSVYACALSRTSTSAGVSTVILIIHPSP